MLYIYIYIYKFSGAGAYRGVSGARGYRGGPGAGGGRADGQEFSVGGCRGGCTPPEPSCSSGGGSRLSPNPSLFVEGNVKKSWGQLETSPLYGPLSEYKFNKHKNRLPNDNLSDLVNQLIRFQQNVYQH